MARSKQTSAGLLFGDFSQGLYLLNTPRLLSDQKKSLALTGGRNVWSETGALIPQYGYETLASIDETNLITGWTRTSSTNNSIFMTTANGEVYYYLANQGLKKYSTILETGSSPLLSRYNKQMIAYVDNEAYSFGSYYDDSEYVQTIPSVDVSIYTGYYKVTCDAEYMEYLWNDKEIHIKALSEPVTKTYYGFSTDAGVMYYTDYLPVNGDNDINIYDANLDLLASDGICSLFAFSGDDYLRLDSATLNNVFIRWSDSLDITVEEEIDTDAEEEEDNTDSDTDTDSETEWRGTVLEVALVDGMCEFSFTTDTVVDEPAVKFANGIEVGEKALYGFALEYVYTPADDTSNPDSEIVVQDNYVIVPTLFEVCNNRLFVVDITGTIFYSTTGLLDNFEEEYGAGYFGGFYGDTSSTLSLEEYKDYVLISKENGLYLLSIGDTLTVEKIANIGQQYAGDHCIVSSNVYAYDSNSGNLVNAITTNYFGTVTNGDVMIQSNILTAQSLGINDTQRKLVYSAENDAFILYYGTNLNNGLVINSGNKMFPRELDKGIHDFVSFNQGVLSIAYDNSIAADFKADTMIPNLTSIAEFEAIGLRDSRFTSATILDFIELNGVAFRVDTANVGFQTQEVIPSTRLTDSIAELPSFLYSLTNDPLDSYELTSSWANKTSSSTKIASCLSGNNGISITLEYPENLEFCLAAISIPDFSQGT